MLLNACALQSAGKSDHTHRNSGDRTFEGGGYCFNRKRTDSWSPRWEEEGWAARGDCASAKSLTFSLSSSRMAEHVDGHPAKYMNFPAARTCVAVLKEANAGVLMPCHWGPVQNKAIRPEATHRFCP